MDNITKKESQGLEGEPKKSVTSEVYKEPAVERKDKSIFRKIVEPERGTERKDKLGDAKAEELTDKEISEVAESIKEKSLLEKSKIAYRLFSNPEFFKIDIQKKLSEVKVKGMENGKEVEKTALEILIDVYEEGAEALRTEKWSDEVLDKFLWMDNLIKWSIENKTNGGGGKLSEFLFDALGSSDVKKGEERYEEGMNKLRDIKPGEKLEKESLDFLEEMVGTGGFAELMALLGQIKPQAKPAPEGEVGGKGVAPEPEGGEKVGKEGMPVPSEPKKEISKEEIEKQKSRVRQHLEKLFSKDNLHRAGTFALVLFILYLALEGEVAALIESTGERTATQRIV